MIQEQKLFLKRGMIGGLCGLLAMALVIFFTNGISILGGPTNWSDPALVSHGAMERMGPLAFPVQCGLMFALGWMVGIATIPFDDDGKTLIRNSLLHFVVTAVLVVLLGMLCLDLDGDGAVTVVWLLLLPVYVVIWLGRWVGWWLEVAQIRAKLGLVPARSPLGWRETLPYLPYLLLVCTLLPFLAHLLDPADVPVLSGMLIPFVLFPPAGFFSGLSLGRRQGFCPLFPLAAAVLHAPMIPLIYNSSAWHMLPIFPVSALLGNLVGWLLKRRKK